MNISTIKEELQQNGYCIIKNVLSSDEIKFCKEKFYDWKKTIPNHDKMHSTIDPHGIYKYHRVGHTYHGWYLRTHDVIQDIYKQLWNTEELIVSFDGCCWIPKNTKKKDNCWTHSDQAPNDSALKCYQGFVSLTDNKERTLRLYEGSHKLHKEYFKKEGITNNKNWNLINEDYLEEIKDSKKILEVPAGSLVLWDSRTFHQNQYGLPNSEERLVQYICFFPKNHIKNTDAIKKKRLKYYKDQRTTSHWPAPIYVNGLQPRTYGDKTKTIDYSKVSKTDLTLLEDKIIKLI
uniref:Phytanoyl-CoA dioxygenase n=1 Tax=Megaviridae environmental sample TaxID=1737588 RepID=A0A5J6VKD4_9VIRU|nr:MAG: hypothetical protein [Megaviridae environmental sample]